jgi:hypothetical protein
VLTVRGGRRPRRCCGADVSPEWRTRPRVVPTSFPPARIASSSERWTAALSSTTLDDSERTGLTLRSRDRSPNPVASA